MHAHVNGVANSAKKSSTWWWELELDVISVFRFHFRFCPIFDFILIFDFTLICGRLFDDYFEFGAGLSHRVLLFSTLCIIHVWALEGGGEEELRRRCKADMSRCTS